jgi:hypothetical protein
MPPPESPLQVDDLLREILLRLPPRTSSLPRASLVCARWRRIISDPQFLRRFRAHHHEPQLLGFFVQHLIEYSFLPALEPPDCIPADRVTMPKRCHDYSVSLSSGHWTPLSFGIPSLIGSVVYPSQASSRSLRKRHSPLRRPIRRPRARRLLLEPFQQLVLLRGDHTKRACAYIYQSKNNTWGTFVPTISIPSELRTFRPSVLVQKALYWALDDGAILELDLRLHRYF